MKCQICNQNAATIHITEIPSGQFAAEKDSGAAEEKAPLVQRHLCESCAQNLNLPQMQVSPKSVVNIWKLLQQSAKKAREEGGLSCPDCGMSLAEFRSKGRLGCPKDYEVFKAHLIPLLQRIHNASRHVGRLPGLDEQTLRRMNQLNDLRQRLQAAIREEDYEDAARLRDEIQGIETTASQG
ncbi:MAG: UvrB/UvrC motif-containing protein [Planctomycetota bacterium]